MTMIEGFTTKEIAAAVELTERAIRKQSQAWSGGIKRPKGKGLMFPLESLPEKIRQKMTSIYKEQNGSPEPDNDDRTGNPSDSCPDHSPSHALALVEHAELVGGQIAQEVEDEQLRTRQLDNSIGQPLRTSNADGGIAKGGKPQREPSAVGRPKGAKGDAKIDAWVEIFKARKAWCVTQGIAKQVDCDGAFSEAYLRHEIDLPEEVYETVTRISRSTIARKRSENEKGGVTALAGKEGAGRPK
jgi:hypothetical protein